MLKQSFRRRASDAARLRAKYRRDPSYRLKKANAYRARVGKPPLTDPAEIGKRTMNAILPAKMPKKAKRERRWRSPAHTKHVSEYPCVNCGSTTNVIAAHYRYGSGAGLGTKPDDWRTTPLCDGPYSNVEGQLGCHQVQHAKGEPSFWAAYAKRKGHTVLDLIEELIRTSPKRGEIERVRRERANA